MAEVGGFALDMDIPGKRKILGLRDENAALLSLGFLDGKILALALGCRKKCRLCKDFLLPIAGKRDKII